MSINYISLDKAYNNQSLNTFFDPQTYTNHDNGRSYEDAMYQVKNEKAKKIIDINHIDNKSLCDIHMSHIQRCKSCSAKLKELIKKQMLASRQYLTKKDKINAIIIVIIILMLFITLYSWDSGSRPMYSPTIS